MNSKARFLLHWLAALLALLAGRRCRQRFARRSTGRTGHSPRRDGGSHRAGDAQRREHRHAKSSSAGSVRKRSIGWECHGQPANDQPRLGRRSLMRRVICSPTTTSSAARTDRRAVQHRRRNQSLYEANVVAIDVKSDVALLKLMRRPARNFTRSSSRAKTICCWAKPCWRWAILTAWAARCRAAS